MISVNNSSPHSYRSACISYFSVSLTKAAYWRRLLWLTLQELHSLSWGGQSSGQGRHGTGRSLASTLRKWRASRGWGWHLVSQPAPITLVSQQGSTSQGFHSLHKRHHQPGPSAQISEPMRDSVHSNPNSPLSLTGSWPSLDAKCIQSNFGSRLDL